jgi:hypothetical protein
VSTHGARRTPENIAYVNGAHSVRNNDTALTLEEFAATYSSSSGRVERCYRRYLEGRTDALLELTR